jgi:predicted 2-oxoglutarate/Fe(II)-dependent dioxygenase YbiX
MTEEPFQPGGALATELFRSTAIQRLASDAPDHAALVDLAGVYHNLLRCWADA